MEIVVQVNAAGVDLTTVIGQHRIWSEEYDEWASEPETLGDAVAKLIAADLKVEDGYKTLQQRVLEKRDAEVVEQVKPIVAAAIEASVQPTNSYGQPVGAPVTLTEVIVKEARELLNKRSDYGRGPTYLQQVMAEAVDKAIKKELAEVIAEEKAKVVAAVRAKAAELIAEAVKQGIGR